MSGQLVGVLNMLKNAFSLFLDKSSKATASGEEDKRSEPSRKSITTTTLYLLSGVYYHMAHAISLHSFAHGLSEQRGQRAHAAVV